MIVNKFIWNDLKHRIIIIFQYFYFLIMNSSQSISELSSDELKIRELAEQYLKIQENTQFLTNVLRFQSHKKRIQMNVELNIPDIKSIASLTVQLSYFLFTCQVKQTNVYISQKLYFLNPNKREINPEACFEYILQKDLLKLPEEYQQYLKKHFNRHQFSANQNRAYGQYALQYINGMVGLVRSQMDKFKSQTDKMMLRQFTMMEEIIRNFIEPKIKTLQHPRIVILALQESELFRQNSILVKVMNNSIFTAIRNSRHKNVFEQICKMEYNLAQIKVNKNQIEAHARQMELSIQNLFRFLIKCQIITVEQSINDVSKMDPNNKNQPQNMNPNNANIKPYVLGEIQGTNADRRYTCRIQVSQKPIRQFNSKVYDSIVQQAMNDYRNDGETNEMKPPNEIKSGSKNQFLIQYMPSKGIISVKYITAIELNIENTDLIMFQCNSIAFHWSNVSMELVEKAPNKPVKRKERYLAFKTLSHLHISERPLFKMLIMLDLVMLCAKIAEPQLRKTIIKSQDYNRIQQITEKVDHMIKLFIKKIERFYKMISQAEFAKNNGQ